MKKDKIDMDTTDQQGRSGTMKATCIPDSDREYIPGTVVLIRAEWDGDNTPHVIVEWNGDRGFIRPLEWPHGAVIPCELVTSEMIQPASQH